MPRNKWQVASGKQVEEFKVKGRRSSRVEDLEDLRDANEAIARNASKPENLWNEVKKELGL